MSNRRRADRVALMLTALAGALLPLAPMPAAAVEDGPSSGTAMTVPGTSNLFLAGRSSAGDGTTPPSIAVPAGSEFVTVGPTTGTTDFGGGAGAAGAEGLDDPSNLDSTNGISGLLADRGQFLAGVFLTDDLSATAPARLDFRAASPGFGIGWPGLSPEIAQSFFVGDGLDEFGFGQKIYVPEGATRLFLGFGDGTGLAGTPAWYNDNTGQLDTLITFGTDSTEPPVDPPISTFELDAEGWGVSGDPTSADPQRESTGGNPGGFIRTVDGSTGVDMYWDAPAKFLGDMSAYIGGELQFDLRQAATDGQYDADDVVLVGAGNTLAYDTASNPGTEWTHYDVPLVAESGWTSGGAAATADQLAATLADLESLRIRAEYRSGADTDDLDNVMLVEPADPATTWDLNTDLVASVEGGSPDDNPFADSTGEPVWRFTSQEFAVGSARTTLPAAETECDSRIRAWVGATAASITTAETFTGVSSGCSTTAVWPQNKTVVHPSSSHVATAVEWTSPISGTVSVRGSLVDSDTAAGNGVEWRVDDGETALAGGVLADAGTAEFDDPDLDAIAVDPGDTIAVVVGTNGDYAFDLTQVEFTITAAEPAVSPGTWDLGADTTAHVEGDDADANPFSDSEGNEVWRFAHQAFTFGSSRTTLTVSDHCDDRIHGWAKDGVSAEITTGDDFVGTACISNQVYAGDEVVLHPSNTGLAAVAEWTSPIDGAVAITGGVIDRDPSGGSGIAWRVDGPDAAIASGAIPNGGSQHFLSGNGGSGLASVDVNVGDTIAVVIDANGGYDFDLTQVDLTITEIEHVPTTWDFAADATTHVEGDDGDANPFADSHGNDTTWRLAHQPVAFGSTRTALVNVASCDSRIHEWAKDGVGVGIQTGADFVGSTCVGGQQWVGDKFMLHPSNTGLAAVAEWTSPIEGTVRISGGVVDRDHGGGSGIAWRVDGPLATLASGVIGNGGYQMFEQGADGDALAAVDVAVGDTIAVIVDPNGGYDYDLTQVDFTITSAQPAVEEPEPFDLSVSKDGTGTGTVTSDPAGIDCGTTCTASFDEGTEVTLSATADTGSEFAGWTGCTPDTSEPTICTVTITEATGATATFDTVDVPPPTYRTLTVATSGTGTGSVTGTGIDCPGDCTESVLDGSTVQLTAAPTGGATFTGWTGDCAGAGTSLTCSVTLAADSTVGAVFTAPPAAHAVTVTVSGSGSVSGGAIACPTACTTTVDHGDSLTLTATPANGHSFTGWTGDCAAAGSNRTCVVTPTGDAEVGATFEQVRRGLQIALVTSASNITIGQGLITSSPAGIDCGADCFEAYDANTMVRLTITPAAGSRVGSVSGCGFLSHTTSHSTCTVGVTGLHTVTVRFDGHPHLFFGGSPQDWGTVSVTTAHGTCGTGCARVAPGTVVKLSASPTAGHRVSGWTNCPGASGATCTMTMPKTDTGVTALFTEAGRTEVVLQPAAGGTVVFGSTNPPSQPCATVAPVNGSCLSFAEGARVNVVAVPATGHRHVAGGTGCTWTSTNGVVDPGCTLTARGSSVKVLAAFSPIPRALDIDIVGQGRVRVNSAFDCTAPGCTLTGYPHGYLIDLEPLPGLGHSFGGWGTTCSELRTNNVCRVTLDGDKNVVATFTPLPGNRSVALTLSSSDVSPDANGIWAATTARVVVRNTGAASVASTTVDLTLPEFVGSNGSLSPSCWQQSRRVIRCAIGALAPNGSVTESISIRPWYPRVPGDGHLISATIPADGNNADNESSARLVARHAPNTQYVKVTDGELGSIEWSVPGQTVQWAFDSTGTRRIEDTTLLNNGSTPLYTSPSITGFGAYRLTFHQAGRYTYLESGSGRTGFVDIGLITGIKAATNVPIRWGASFLNQFSSIVVDCDKWVGAGPWVQWVRGSKQQGQTYYTTAGSGQNHLRCRVRDTASGRTSGWSPTLTVTF